MLISRFHVSHATFANIGYLKHRILCHITAILPPSALNQVITRQGTNHSHDIPIRNPAKHHRHPALLLPILLDRDTPPIPTIEISNAINIHFRPELRRRHITPPDSIALLKRNVITIRTIQSLQVQDVKVVLSATTTHGIPVRTDLLEHEAGRGALMCAHDGVGQWRERWRCEAFVA